MKYTWAAVPRRNAMKLSEYRRQRIRRLAIAVFAGAAMMLVGFGTSESTTVPSTTLVNSYSLAKSGTTRSATGVSGLKSPLLGLLDRQGAPAPSFYSVLDGFVVNASWASLQTSAGGPITSNNAIDKALTQVRLANASGAHLALKLRAFAGIQAPGWAKSIGGAPITVRDPHSNITGTVGRFWTAAFGQAYQDFETKLAAKYDGIPEVREVTISRCTTVNDEPFIRQITDPTTVANLWNAGYTVSGDQACQQQEIEAHAVWTLTRSDLSFNPYQEILSASSVKTDEAFTQVMITYCTDTLGANCIVENNSLRSTSQGKDYDSMYAAMKAQSANIVFQTAMMAKIGSLPATLLIAVGYGAGSVELPSGYETNKASSYAAVRLQLIGNARP
jgi:hypothetical protein